MKSVVIAGVGPGLSAALARRFARAGAALGLISRREDHLTPVAREVEALGARSASAAADVGDAAQLNAAISSIARTLGDAHTFIYNAGGFTMGSVLDLEPAELERIFRVGCTGALIGARAVLPA